MRFFVSFLFLVVCVFANPSWYGNLDRKDTLSYIGYGSGFDSKSAKQEALNDIVSQISVKITTSFSDVVKDIDGDITTVSEIKSLQNVDATLNDYKLLKSEYIDEKYFVAIEYENIPSLDKFLHKINKIKKMESSTQNSYLEHTQIAKELHKSLKYDIDFQLLRKDKKWFIKYNSILQTLDKKDFSKFFSSVSTKNIEIHTNKKRDILYDGDRFFFKIKSAKDGFISVLSVYENGTVATLVRNIKVQKSKIENIPDENFESIPEAGLLEKGVETYDLYVAIYSNKKLRFDSFTYADDSLVSEEKYKNFDELIEFLDTKIYSTLKVVTKPRN